MLNAFYRWADEFKAYENGEKEDVRDDAKFFTECKKRKREKFIQGK